MNREEGKLSHPKTVREPEQSRLVSAVNLRIEEGDRVGVRRSGKTKPTENADLVGVLEAVRSMWDAAEKAEPPVREWVTKKVVEGIARLKKQTDEKLRLASNTTARQQPLFAPEPKKPVPKPEPKRKSVRLAPVVVRFPEPELRVYAKDLAGHALKQLPSAAGCSSIEELRKLLVDKLSFNSQATRQRNASYLISRFFSGEVLNSDLPPFAAATAGTPTLGEALFYLTCRTEKLVALVAEEVVFPSLAQGGIARTNVTDFIQTQMPKSKSARQCSTAVANTYQTFGIGSATRTRLNVSLREGSLASFAYVLHLEFPEPGMYSFERLVDGPMHKCLLWDQKWMVQQLYRLREAGLLSKVSEIDRMRQFTTKYPLAEAVQPIVDLAKESSS
jgi:DNA repair protein RadC